MQCKNQLSPEISSGGALTCLLNSSLLPIFRSEVCYQTQIFHLVPRSLVNKFNTLELQNRTDKIEVVYHDRAQVDKRHPSPPT